MKEESSRQTLIAWTDRQTDGRTDRLIPRAPVGAKNS